MHRAVDEFNVFDDIVIRPAGNGVITHKSIDGTSRMIFEEVKVFTCHEDLCDYLASFMFIPKD